MYALDSSVRDSFSRAKQDIENLRQENATLRAIVFELKEAMSKNKDAASEAIAVEPGVIQHTSNIKAALKEVLEEMGAYEHQRPAVSRLSSPIALAASSDDSITRFGLDKKAIIKAKIVDIIGQAPVMLPRLKEIIVDQNTYCSKASFYRYIDELLKEENVSIISMNGKSVVRANKMELYA